MLSVLFPLCGYVSLHVWEKPDPEIANHTRGCLVRSQKSFPPLLSPQCVCFFFYFRSSRASSSSSRCSTLSPLDTAGLQVGVWSVWVWPWSTRCLLEVGQQLKLVTWKNNPTQSFWIKHELRKINIKLTPNVNANSFEPDQWNLKLAKQKVISRFFHSAVTFDTDIWLIIPLDWLTVTWTDDEELDV